MGISANIGRMDCGHMGFILIITCVTFLGLLAGIAITSSLKYWKDFYQRVIRYFMRMSSGFLKIQNPNITKMGGDNQYSLRCGDIPVRNHHWAGVRDNPNGDSDDDFFGVALLDRKDDLFPIQRREALSELCLQYENIMYLVVSIILGFHVFAGATKREKSVWEYYMENVGIPFYTIVNYMDKLLKRLANCACNNIF